MLSLKDGDTASDVAPAAIPAFRNSLFSRISQLNSTGHEGHTIVVVMHAPCTKCSYSQHLYNAVKYASIVHLQGGRVNDGQPDELLAEGTHEAGVCIFSRSPQYSLLANALQSA